MQKTERFIGENLPWPARPRDAAAPDRDPAPGRAADLRATMCKRFADGKWVASESAVLLPTAESMCWTGCCSRCRSGVAASCTSAAPGLRGAT